MTYYYLLLATHKRFFSLFKIQNQQYEHEELIIWKEQENCQEIIKEIITVNEEGKSQNMRKRLENIGALI